MSQNPDLRDVSFHWLAAASAVPGKALHLAVALSWLAQRDRSVGVRLTRRTLRRFSVSRDAAYDGLRRLEARGLVQVWRLPGRAPHVILLDPGADSDVALRVERTSTCGTFC